jgi:tetratricopeptide (TPR) repeat protein
MKHVRACAFAQSGTSLFLIDPVATPRLRPRSHFHRVLMIFETTWAAIEDTAMNTTLARHRVLATVLAMLGVPAIGAQASEIRLAQGPSPMPPFVQGCTSESVAMPQRIADCTKLIAAVPANLREKAYLARGHAYRDGGDLAHAINDYSMAIKLAPQDKEALYSRGYVLHDKREFDRAIADYTAAIAIDRNDADTFYGRALSFQAKGDLDHAIADYTMVIRLKPNFANAYNNRAVAYRKKGDMAEANNDAAAYARLSHKGD